MPASRKNIRERHASLQALKDAIDVRALLFETMPYVATADLRVYRMTAHYERELIITGCVQRIDHFAQTSTHWPCAPRFSAFVFKWKTKP